MPPRADTLRGTYVVVGLLAIAIPLTGAAAARAVWPTYIDLHGEQALYAPAPHSNRVVLYVHGAGERKEALFASPEKQPLAEALFQHGFSLASMEAEGTVWGDEKSLNDYLALIRYLHRVGDTRVYLLCQSMGGLDGLRLIDRTRLEAWAGIYPLANLSTIVWTSRPGIEQTLGSSFGHYWTSLSPEHIRYPAGLQMMLWASYEDTVVPRAENTDVIATTADREGAIVSVVSTEGEHGDPSNFQPEQLVDFYENV